MLCRACIGALKSLPSPPDAHNPPSSPARP
jgi:hypothetical protein